MMAAVPLDPADLAELRDALAGAGLPVADPAKPGRAFCRSNDDAGLVGFGGLEGEPASAAYLVKALQR